MSSTLSGNPILLHQIRMSRIEVCVEIKFVGQNLALLLTGFDWTGKMAFFTMFSGKMFFGIVFVGIRVATNSAVPHKTKFMNNFCNVVLCQHTWNGDSLN